MAYNPDIPQTGDNLSTSQGQILGNFQALNTIFNFDHYAWNDSVTANQGLHRKVEFPATNTIGALGGLSSVIYSKNVSNVASPYFKNAVNDYAMWYGGTTSNGLASTTLGNPGSLNLPNGFQMKWGQAQFGSGSSTQPVGYSANFPVASDSVQITRAGGNTNTPAEDVFLVTLASNSGFTARRMSPAPAAVLNFYWFAIGH